MSPNESGIHGVQVHSASRYPFEIIKGQILSHASALSAMAQGAKAQTPPLPVPSTGQESGESRARLAQRKEAKCKAERIGTGSALLALPARDSQSRMQHLAM